MASQPWTQEPGEPKRGRETGGAAGKSLRLMARQVWLAGLGAMAATGEEGAHLFHLLVERGTEVEPTLSEGWTRLRDEWSERMQKAARQVRSKAEEAMPDRDKIIRQAMEHLELATRRDLELLSQRMEALARQVAELAQHAEPEAPAPKSPRRKTAPRARRKAAETGEHPARGRS